MKDMWKSRAPPIPLDHDGILNDSFVLRQGVPEPATAPSTSSTSANLKDQRRLTLKDNLLLFLDSTNRLASRLRSGEATIAFDKDDPDTLDFVTAASNLRSAAYGIPTKTLWDVKEMAGNIIPAIATTNAIVSGLIVLQALHILKGSYEKLKNVHLQYKPAVPLSVVSLSAPNKQCGVCRDTYAVLRCDPARATLGEVVKGVLGDDEREVSVYEGQRVLSDPDWDDNNERTLESLGVTRGKFLAIVDEEGELSTISLGIALLPCVFFLEFHLANNFDEVEYREGEEAPFILPSPLPKPSPRPKPPAPAPDTPKKGLNNRDLPVENADGVIDLAPTPKKPKFKTSPGAHVPPSLPFSRSLTRLPQWTWRQQRRNAKERICRARTRRGGWRRMG